MIEVISYPTKYLGVTRAALENISKRNRRRFGIEDKTIKEVINTLAGSSDSIEEFSEASRKRPLSSRDIGNAIVVFDGVTRQSTTIPLEQRNAVVFALDKNQRRAEIDENLSWPTSIGLSFAGSFGVIGAVATAENNIPVAIAAAVTEVIYLGGTLIDSYARHRQKKRLRTQ